MTFDRTKAFPPLFWLKFYCRLLLAYESLLRTLVEFQIVFGVPSGYRRRIVISRSPYL